MKVGEILCKTALNRSRIPGYRYCLNPYLGCAHGCRYCYADTTLRFSGHPARWGEFVAAKVNFPEVLRRQLGRKGDPAGRILVGTVTDAYQPAEAEYGLTRACLEALLEVRPEARVDVLTKSELVVRDADLWRRLRHSSVGFTVTTIRDEVAAALEPGASPPRARIRAAARLRAAGVPVWAFVAPLLPGLTDAPGALEELVRALVAAGVRDISVDPLNPYPAAVARLREAYARHLRRATGQLERYLSDPRGYLRGLPERLARLERLYGCRVAFC
ncbi:MAG: radical SAM protein [Firmicutes bacterium]|nr:radical SAM protein [Bacillota bacterium]